MISISHWGLFSAEFLPDWTRDRLLEQHRILPYWNCRFEGDPKTFGEHARENLKRWAENRSPAR